jgi:endonuclease/exonuclease/phosphatase family metal-dependent hydrolase
MKKILLILAVLSFGLTTVSAHKVRVMSYNVHNCGGIDGLKSIERCADVIRQADADVIAIQEVDSMTQRNNKYMLGELAERTGYHAYFGKTIPYKGGSYGIGVLSKEPALSVKFHPLPCRKEPRGLLILEFKSYYFLATHLSLVKPDQLASVDIIRDIVAKLDKPVFLAGDLNAKPHTPTMDALRSFMKVLSDEKQFTFPADVPSRCIDYVLGANGAFKVLNNYVFYNSLASDHLPLYVNVKIKRQRNSKKKVDGR